MTLADGIIAAQEDTVRSVDVNRTIVTFASHQTASQTRVVEPGIFVNSSCIRIETILVTLLGFLITQFDEVV